VRQERGDAEPVPASFAQQRLWFLNRLEGRSSTYNAPWAIRLRGVLNHDALRQALNDVIDRHETLRTVFTELDGAAVPLVLGPGAIGIDLQATAVSEDELTAAVEAAVDAGFDLSSAEALIRAHLFDVTGGTPTSPDATTGEWVLVVVMHHVVTDAWSMARFAQDLSTAYAARCEGRAPGWPPLPVRYADYALWQRDLLGSPDDPGSLASGQIAYWTETLRGAPEELTLPAIRTRPAVASHRGGQVSVGVNAWVHRQLVGLARESWASVFMVLQATFATLLSRLGAGTDIPIGTPIAGRTDEALDGLVGVFLNTLVLRTDLTDDPTFRQLLGRVRETDLAAYSHQDVPFEQLVDVLQPTRSLARNPLFQVMLVLQNTVSATGTASADLPGLTAATVPVWGGSAKFDLTLIMAEVRDAEGTAAGVQGMLEYSLDLFDQAAAEQITTRLIRTLEAVAADPDQPISAIELMDRDERHGVLVEWNDTARPVRAATLPDLFEARAAAAPQSVAVVSDDAELSCGQLNARANRLARLLIERGVGPESIVALALPCTVDLVVAVLAVVKAGGAFLPVDVEYPAQRIGHMLTDAAPVCVITASEVAPTLPATAPVLVLDDPVVIDACAAQSDADPVDADRTAALLPAHPAYVIYTSGSAGAPQGVVVTHAGIAGNLAWMQREHSLGAQDRVLLKGRCDSGDSVQEMFWPLTAGAVLIVARPGPGYLADTIISRGVTAVRFVPSLLAEFALDPGFSSCSSLTKVFCSGESLPEGLAADVTGVLGASLYNLYGPAEASVDVTAWRYERRDDGLVPIGSPVHNTRVYVLDGRLQPVPPGVPGELYITGAQLARGYLHLAALTAERFIACPYGDPGERMYRTGDVVRWSPDGQLMLVGRTDNQVNMRGFRVELGEVETVLAAHAGVARAVAVAREDQAGDRRLVAYVVLEAGVSGLDPAVLRRYASEVLPDHMVPSAIVVLDALPLIADVRIDRAALPAPDLPEGVSHRGPRDRQEETLCTVIADVLGLDRVGIDDGFFDLGGDSVLAIKLVSRARAAGLVLSLKDVFQYQSVAGLVSANAVESTADPTEETGGVGDVMLTPAMRQLLESTDGTDGISQSRVLVAPAGLETANLHAVVQAVLDRHDMLRARLRREADGWVLAAQAPGSVRAEECVLTVDISGLDNAEVRRVLAEQAVEASARLAPESGAMVRVVRLDAGSADGWMLWVIHGLVVDEASWRIVAADAAAACRAVAAGQNPVLEPVPASFRRTAERIARDAADPARAAELLLWRQILRTPDPLLGRRRPDQTLDTTAARRSLTEELSPDWAQPLLTDVLAAFYARIDDVLLAGLAVAVDEWRRGRGPANGTAVLLDVAENGRGETVPGTDLSRTVGRFTCVYPARLDPGSLSWPQVCSDSSALSRAVKQIKEQLRAVPHDGIGFGMLRYLNPVTAGELAGLGTPQIGFAYLGRCEARSAAGTACDPAHLGDGGLPGDGRLPGGVGPDLPPTHVVELSAMTVDMDDGPHLLATWRWSPEALDERDVRELAGLWFTALRSVVTHTGGRDAGGHTPSDFSLAALTQADIDDLDRLFESTDGDGK
jgi:amino acid adenylation domain-containing protein/non-ribosomal peptide synthase protein (TIGR01720 family)